jgi:signal peptidase I
MAFLDKFYNFNQFKRKRNILHIESSSWPDFIISIKNFVFSSFKFLFLVYFIFMPFFFIFAYVPSPSMTPTLHTHDITTSSVLAYGIRLSNVPILKNILDDKISIYKIKLSDIPILNLLVKDKKLFNLRLLQFKKPSRGDIVSFSNPKIDENIIFCKTIVGIPGDKIQFMGGVMYINNQPCALKYKGIYTYVENEKIFKGDLYAETLPNGIVHDVMYLKGLGNGNSDNTEIYTVPENHYFLIGNNRHDSDDSRSLLGYINYNDIYGKVFVVFLSNGNLTSLSVKKLIGGMKWERLLMPT